MSGGRKGAESARADEREAIRIPSGDRDGSGDGIRAVSIRVGRGKGRFDAIRVDYPPHTDAAAAIDVIRIAALDREEGEPCGGGFLVAATGVGKTETVKMIERIINSEAPEGRRPILRVEFSVKGTTGSIPQAILAALGSRNPTAGTEDRQWERAIEDMRAAGVQVLILDEFNRAARRPTMSAPIALSIQEWIMDPGVCPVVIVGSAKASTVLRSVPSVNERLDEEIDLRPLDWLNAVDREVAVDFLRDLDAAIRDEGILPATSGLDEGDVPRLLVEASAGKLRAIVKTVRFALGLALARGDASMTREDLSTGVAKYCVRQRLVRDNPFERAASTVYGDHGGQVGGAAAPRIADEAEDGE